MLFWSC